MGEGMTAKHNAKDSVFTHLFSDKKYVLQLYQALHPEDTDATEDMIEIVTLENVLVGGSYNDLGFLLGDRLLILAEAQSTWSMNILVRSLMYVTETYHKYIKDRDMDLYGSKRVALPRPELYVIYTGAKQIRQGVYTLSEEFFAGQVTDLDVHVHVLTDGREGDILFQYVGFAKVFDGQYKLYGPTARTIEETIRICKDRNLLAEYLAQHEREVQDIMITLFDEEWILKAHDKTVLEEGRAEGEAKGRAEGEAKGRAEGEAKGRAEEKKKNARSFLREGLPAEMIARAIGMPLEEVNALQAELAK